MQRVHALSSLVGRYTAIMRSAWANRKSLENPHRTSHELMFLPASLELAETPIHPAPHWSMRLIALLTLCVLAVALFGRLDIVVTSKGKFVPNNRVKVIQPAITGVVREILVVDGQRVKAGQPLIKFDDTQARADATNAHEDKVANALDAARASALLVAQSSGKPVDVPLVADALKPKQDEAQFLAEGEYREYLDKLAEGKATLEKDQADLDSTQHDIDRLKETAPMARQEANDYKSLVKDKYVSQIDYLEKEQAAVQEEHDFDAKTSYLQELKATVVAQEAQNASLTSQFRREQLDAENQAQQKYEEALNNEIKALSRQKLLSLYSPVDGTVQQLATHTIGGVATAAQEIMEIVPDDALEVEADIENKDIGFIRPGQDAVVKIEAFPYTRYGYLHGVVSFISNDAVDSKKEGLTFVAHVKLQTDRLRVENQLFQLTPGMAVTAEIKTGKRTVAGYFLNPLVQTTAESLRER